VGGEDVRAFFERVPAQWDDMRSSFYNADVIEALAERGHITASSRIADVGTGTIAGRTSHEYRQHRAV
jgi:hypothetical protein